MPLSLHHLAKAVALMERNYNELYEVRVSEDREHLDRIARDLEETARLVRSAWIDK